MGASDSPTMRTSPRRAQVTTSPLIDACRDEAGGSRNADTNAMPNPTRGTAALFSCKGGERAFETDKLEHGVFFHFVIEALKGEGKAKNKRGAVTWDGLTRHVR